MRGEEEERREGAKEGKKKRMEERKEGETDVINEAS